MDTVRETTVYPAKIRLLARDQYNDYSVIYDHVLEVDDDRAGYHRRWELGTDRSKAIHAYDTAVAAIAHARAEAA